MPVKWRDVVLSDAGAVQFVVERLVACAAGEAPSPTPREIVPMTEAEAAAAAAAAAVPEPEPEAPHIPLSTEDFAMLERARARVSRARQSHADTAWCRMTVWRTSRTRFNPGYPLLLAPEIPSELPVDSDDDEDEVAQLNADRQKEIARRYRAADTFWMKEMGLHLEVSLATTYATSVICHYLAPPHPPPNTRSLS
jgi:hypothetical protein